MVFERIDKLATKERDKSEDLSEGSRSCSLGAEKKSFSLSPKHAAIEVPLLCFRSATNK